MKCKLFAKYGPFMARNSSKNSNWLAKKFCMRHCEHGIEAYKDS